MRTLEALLKIASKLSHVFEYKVNICEKGLGMFSSNLTFKFRIIYSIIIIFMIIASVTSEDKTREQTH